MFKWLRERFRDLSNWQVLSILLGVAILSAVFSAIVRGGLDSDWWGNLSQGLVTEMAGAAATFWLINLIFEGRRKREEKAEALEEKKSLLIRKMGSNNPAEAARAVKEIRDENWHRDGSLKGVILANAKLPDVNLIYADLEGAKLDNADLRGAQLAVAQLHEANLSSAQLDGANLKHANLQEANLANAVLIGADLTFADLRGANLNGTNLHKANLQNANLQEASLEETQFGEGTTTLPDGNKWKRGTPTSHFTNPTYS